MAGDNNGLYDVFVKDLVTGQVTMLGNSALGGQANGLSTGPAFSPDGSKVAFVSEASNLLMGDTNNVTDVFVQLIGVNYS